MGMKIEGTVISYFKMFCFVLLLALNWNWSKNCYHIPQIYKIKKNTTAIMGKEILKEFIYEATGNRRNARLEKIKHHPV